MARGDYYDVWLKEENQPRRVQATRIGATVSLDMGVMPATPGRPPSPPAEFITVTEIDKANVPIRTFYFARSEVQSIEQGNQMIKSRK